MTYCVAMSLKEGLIFISDSRTNAGIDQLSTYSKMHQYGDADRFFVLLSSGNLATTQGVIHSIDRDIHDKAPESLFTASDLVEAAAYIGHVSADEQKKHHHKRLDQEFLPEASFVLGGQIRGSQPEIIHIYPEGNFIHASETLPFLQIGETKYGKPILDRIIRLDTSIPNALKCGLVSMDSTLRSSALVGPPIEYLIYRPNEYRTSFHRILTEDDHYLTELRQAWSDNILVAFENLPSAPGFEENPAEVTDFENPTA